MNLSPVRKRKLALIIVGCCVVAISIALFSIKKLKHQVTAEDTALASGIVMLGLCLVIVSTTCLVILRKPRISPHRIVMDFSQKKRDRSCFKRKK